MHSDFSLNKTRQDTQRAIRDAYFTAVETPVAPVAQRYHVTSDTLGREFDPGKRDFSRSKTKK